MRPTLKRIAERTMVATGAAAVLRTRCRGGSLILAYHDIVPEGDHATGDRSLHLPQASFARQLDILMAAHDVVPLADLLSSSEPTRGHEDRARVAITFDDAYLSAMTAGVAELRARGLPATVFIAPALLGRVTWWDLLGSVGDDMSPEHREHALWTLGGDGNRVREWATSTGLKVSEHGLARIATLEQLTDALRYGQLTPGAHSWSHPNLCTLDATALEAELARPLAWLRERFDRTDALLAYPYGLHSPAVLEGAKTAGYAHAFRVDGGWIPRSATVPALAVPRFNVPAGLSDDGFALRLAGIGTGR